VTYRKSSYTEIKECVACESTRLKQVFDLGSQPLANDYLEKNNEDQRVEFPLCLNVCQDCTHSQLSGSVNPEILFRNYRYVSATSGTLNKYFESLRAKLIMQFGEGQKLLDIGSNDGSFLAKFTDTNWKVLGVDPAINLVQQALDRGILTIPAFFDTKTSVFLSKDFDVITAMNVFAHTSNPLEILLAMQRVVRDDGRIFIQTSQADMFLNGEFDTVYHEHISFFNVKSMKTLLGRIGWSLESVEIVPIHGNSYLWEIVPQQRASSKVLSREVLERDSHLYSLEYYDSFKNRCDSRVKEFSQIVDKYRLLGFEIAAYGLAAKGNTFLNYASVFPKFVFDDTPEKIGLLSPLENALVNHSEKMKSIDEKLLFIIPAWNFANEIVSKIRKLRGSVGDHFVLYFPELKAGPI